MSSTHNSRAASRAAFKSPLPALLQIPSILAFVLEESVEARLDAVLARRHRLLHRRAVGHGRNGRPAGRSCSPPRSSCSGSSRSSCSCCCFPQPATSTPPNSATASHVDSLETMNPPPMGWRSVRPPTIGPSERPPERATLLSWLDVRTVGPQHDDLIDEVESLGSVRDQQHRLSAATAKMSRISSRAVGGSRCAVGSSSTSTGASASSARATARRWRCPPESSLPPRRRACPSRRAAHAPSARSALAPRGLLDLGVGASGARGARSRGSLAENRCALLAGDGDRAAHVLLPVLAQVAAVERDPPGSGSRKRSSRFTTVVLPAPLAPTSASRRPAG